VIDIQVVRLSDVVPVTSISSVPGVSPRSVMLTGRGFQGVESVYLNNSPAPEFVVISETEILAQVPIDQRREAITSAYVLSTKLSFSERSLIEWNIGNRIQTVSGTLLLVQTFARILLRTPGSNAFHKTLGGGLQSAIGRLIGPNARDRIGAELAVAVARTKQQIIASQTPNRRIPPEERLLTASVVGLSMTPREGQVYMSVSVDSHAGTSAAATLVRQ
jgi:hypothetical protein